MELRSLKENDSHRIRTIFWTTLFIVTSFFTFPLHVNCFAGQDSVTIESQTTKDMFSECDEPCNATGTIPVECVSGSCECCDSGYMAIFNSSLNGFDCIDINECMTMMNDCDNINSDCENTEGSFQCNCKNGFDKATSSNMCIDIDECSENVHNCDNITSSCKNTLGSYKCNCKPGFSSDGSDGVCTNINECLMNTTLCNVNIHNCTDTNGSYVCTCLDGTTSCESCKIGSYDCIIVIVIAVIVILIIVAVILIVVILRLRRSRRTPPRPAKSTSDVELEDPGPMYNHTIVPEPVMQGTSNVATLLVFKENIHLGSKISGKGVIEYHKAKVKLPQQDKTQDAVVKTIAEASSSGVSTLIINEVEKLSLLSYHPYIVQLLGWCDTAPPYIIFEFIRGSSLLVGLEEGHVKVSDASNIALQVARGMKFLTENGFLHPGLRAKKILLTESGDCKLYDFVPEEIALELKKLAWNEHTPYQWLSPEYLFLGELTRTGDVWSFGILLWEIFSKGEQPFGDKDRLLVEKCIRQEDPILSKPLPCPGGVWALVLRCWERRPEERPKFQDLSSELFLMTQEKTYEL